MKSAVSAALLILLTSLVTQVWAQVKLTPGQVKEIVISSGAGGIGSGGSAEIKVVFEAGKWRSYLTRKAREEMHSPEKTYDSTLNRFITVINSQIVTKLLSGIGIIKPTITPSTFSLTSEGLISELKKGARTPIKDAPDFRKLITPKIINEVIAKTIKGTSLMDYVEYCSINIVTRDHHSIQLSTRNVCPTKLPWILGKRVTYDMAMNNFIEAAMGNEELPNKEALGISYLKESIYKNIDAHISGAPIAAFKWKYYYPVSLKMLTDHFVITQMFMHGDVYSCTLKTNSMPANSLLYSTIDMSRPEDINKIIMHAALIDKYFKAGNFVFSYYNNRPQTHIGFSFNPDQLPYHLPYQAKKIPDLANADSTQVLSFYVATLDDSSNWTIFPGNIILLTYHMVTTPDGKTAPIYPPQDPKIDWFKRSQICYLFDDAGKVLSQEK